MASRRYSYFLRADEVLYAVCEDDDLNGSDNSDDEDLDGVVSYPSGEIVLESAPQLEEDGPIHGEAADSAVEINYDLDGVGQCPENVSSPSASLHSTPSLSLVGQPRNLCSNFCLR